MRRVRKSLHRGTESRAGKSPGVDGTIPRDAPLGSALFTDTAWSAIARSLQLSKREVQIVREVFDNLKNDAIAANLGASKSTIHTHLHRLFAKLHVTTRTQIVVRIMQELLILTLAKQGSLPPICRHRANGRCPLQV